MKSIYTRFALIALCLSFWVSAVPLAQAANGTQLSTSASVVGSPTCSTDYTSANAQIGVNLESSASTAPAIVEVSTDGGMTFTQQGTITNWSSSGRNKAAELTLSETLVANITTKFEICAAQLGSDGNPGKSSCADLSIDPTCASYIPLTTLDYTANGADFLVVGNWGNQANITDVINVATEMNNTASTSTNFVISLGSNFWKGGIYNYDGVESATDPKFTTLWKNVYTGTPLSQLPWWLILGNHDWYPPQPCPTGQQLVNDACVPDSCTPPQILQNGMCVTPPTSCPTGQGLTNGSCHVGYQLYEIHHQDPNWNLPDYFYVQRFALPGSKYATLIFISDDLLFYGYDGKSGTSMGANFTAAGWSMQANTHLEQLAWIDKALETANHDDYVLVLGHHSIFTCGADAMASVYEGTMLEALIKKWKPTAYMSSGHFTLSYYLTDSALQIGVGSSGNVDLSCAPLAAAPGAELANTYGFAHAQLTGPEFAIQFVTETGDTAFQTSSVARTPVVGVKADTTYLPPVGDPSIHAQ